jgi:hypothetical protein
MEKQIKSLLSSPDEKNQRLGCQMAKSILKWSNFDICMYILNTGKNWNLISRSIYGIEFLGGKIYYSFILTNLNLPNLKVPYSLRLIIRSKTRKKIGSIFIKKRYSKPNVFHLKSYFNTFIKQHL